MARTLVSQEEDAALAESRKPHTEQVLDALGISYTLRHVRRADIIKSDSSQARSIDHLFDKAVVASYVQRYRAGEQPPPIVVKRVLVNGIERFEVIEGNHRHEMYNEVRASTVPAYVVHVITPDQALKVAVRCNIHGFNLDEDELKAAAVKLVRSGSSPAEAASIVNISKFKVDAAIEVDAFFRRAIDLNVPRELLSSEYYEKVDGRKRTLVSKVDMDAPFVNIVQLCADADLSNDEVLNLVRELRENRSESDQLAFLATRREELDPRINFNANPLDKLAAENMSALSRVVVNITKRPVGDYVPATRTDADDTYVNLIIELRTYLGNVLDKYDARP